MAKQEHLPGVESPKIIELENAVDAYREIRDERMAMTKKEVAAKEKLGDLMRKNKLRSYRTPTHVAVREEGKESVRVRRRKAKAAK